MDSTTGVISARDLSLAVYFREQLARHARALEPHGSGALSALVNLDTVRARAGCAMDDEADDMHRSTFEHVEEAVRRHPSEFAMLTHYLSVSRYLERIADHATNIAEDVVYIMEGAIVRHRGGA